MNARSAQEKRAPARVTMTVTGRATTASTRASTTPSNHVRPLREPSDTVRPRATKTAISARLARGPVKLVIDGFVSWRATTDDQPREEDSEKARPVQARRDAVESSGECQGEERMQAPRSGGESGAGLWRAAEPPTSPEGGADAHLDCELAHHDGCRRVRVSRQFDHPDHQCDPGGVVQPRLAFECCPRASADLVVAEHGEHHRRISRRERGTRNTRQRPPETQREVGEEHDDACGYERAEDTESNYREQPIRGSWASRCPDHR